MDCGLCGHGRGHECGHGHGHGNKLATCNSQRLTRLPRGGGRALLIGCLATDGGGASNVRSFVLCLFCAAADAAAVLVIAKRLSATFTTRCCNLVAPAASATAICQSRVRLYRMLALALVACFVNGFSIWLIDHHHHHQLDGGARLHSLERTLLLLCQWVFIRSH